MKKNCDVVTPQADSTATMMGPITRDPLMSVEFNAIAPDKSCGGTRVGSDADHAGAFNALPMPTPHCMRNSNQIAASFAASGNIMNEKNNCNICV